MESASEIVTQLQAGNSMQRQRLQAILEELSSALVVLKDKAGRGAYMSCFVAHGKLVTANVYIEELIRGGWSLQVLTDIREGMRILDTGTNLSDVESAEQKLRPARELISSAFGSASTPTVATPKPASQQPVPGANWARGWLEARG